MSYLLKGPVSSYFLTFTASSERQFGPQPKGHLHIRLVYSIRRLLCFQAGRERRLMYSKHTVVKNRPLHYAPSHHPLNLVSVLLILTVWPLSIYCPLLFTPLFIPSLFLPAFPLCNRNRPRRHFQLSVFFSTACQTLSPL